PPPQHPDRPAQGLAHRVSHGPDQGPLRLVSGAAPVLHPLGRSRRPARALRPRSSPTRAPPLLRRNLLGPADRQLRAGPERRYPARALLHPARGSDPLWRDLGSAPIRPPHRRVQGADDLRGRAGADHVPAWAPADPQGLAGALARARGDLARRHEDPRRDRRARLRGPRLSPDPRSPRRRRHRRPLAVLLWSPLRPGRSLMDLNPRSIGELGQTVSKLARRLTTRSSSNFKFAFLFLNTT